MREHDETVQFIALNNRELPGGGLGDGGHCLRPLVGGIAKIRSMKGKTRPCVD